MSYPKKTQVLIGVLFTFFLIILLILFSPKIIFLIFPAKTGLNGIDFYIKFFLIFLPLLILLMLLITIVLYIREKFFQK